MAVTDAVDFKPWAIKLQKQKELPLL